MKGASTRLAQASSLSLEDRQRLRRDLLQLDAENVRLAEEIKRLRDENQDLRDAAALWIRLYERQLDRANEAVSGLKAQTAGKSA
jgi:hypothetical protein